MKIEIPHPESKFSGLIPQAVWSRLGEYLDNTTCGQVLVELNFNDKRVQSVNVTRKEHFKSK